MTPADRAMTIEQIIDGLYEQERERVLTAGTAKTRRPFYIHFPPDKSDCSDHEAREILTAVRHEFPDWTINGTRRPPSVFAEEQRQAARRRKAKYTTQQQAKQNG